VGKGKLVKWELMKSFSNVIEKDNQFKGNWAKSFFKNQNPIVVELACGKGDYAIGMAKLFPDKNFIGIDIKGNRLFTAANTAKADELNNVGFLRTQIDHLEDYFEKGEISEIWITFPDPFPRKGDVKKRLTSKKFIDIYRKILPPKTTVNLKTDSQLLYEFTKETIENERLTTIKDFSDVYKMGKNEELYGIQTYYEKMHLLDNRTIHFISFEV
jgi:tRNA (guanine-N7-)-methyltransferase